MYLVEGSRAAWVLEEVQHVGDSSGQDPITWVPSRPEKILADGLVMIAAHVIKDPGIRELIQVARPEKIATSLLSEEWADLTELNDECLPELQAAACEVIPPGCKLVVTVMGGSSIEGQLGLLERCSMDAEVCIATWARGRTYENEVVMSGSLPPEDPERHRFTEVRL